MVEDLLVAHSSSRLVMARDRSTVAVRIVFGLLILLSELTVAAQTPPPTADPSAQPPPGVVLLPPDPGPPPSRPPVRERPLGVSRVYLKVRPGVVFDPRSPRIASGLGLFDIGIESNPERGLWIGAELAPLSIVAASSTERLINYSSRIHFGYARDWWAVGLAFGSSRYPYLSDNTRIASQPSRYGYVSIGPILRFGRLTDTFVRIRLFSFSLYAISAVPNSVEIELNVRVRPRVRFHLDLAADAGAGGQYSTAGIQYYLRGDGEPQSDLLTFALGVANFGRSVGPVATFGYERRF